MLWWIVALVVLLLANVVVAGDASLLNKLTWVANEMAIVANQMATSYNDQYDIEDVETKQHKNKQKAM